MIRRTPTIPPRLLMLVSFGGISLLNYAFGLTIGWLLQPSAFGLAAFAQTVLLMVGLILNSGIAWSLTVAIVNLTGQRRADLVRGAMVANLALATALSALIIGLYSLGPLHPGLESRTMVALIALSSPFFAIIAVTRAAVQGAERFGAVAAIQTTEVACKVAAGLALVKAGFGASGAVAGFLVGAVLSAAVGVILVRHSLRIRLRGGIAWPAAPLMAAMFGALLGLALLLNLDLLALKSFSGSARALTGYYQAAIVLANAPYYLVAYAVVPVLFTQLAAMRTIGATRAKVLETLEVVAIFVLPIEGILVLAPRAMLTLFFPVAYAAGAPALRLLAIGNSALIVIVVVMAAFQAVGRATIPARIMMGITAAELAVLCVTVPRFHIVGAAATFVAATVIALIALAFSYLVLLDHSEVWAARDFVMWGLRYAGAVVTSIGTGAIAYALSGTLVIALVGGMVWYGAATLAVGFVRLPNLQVARRLLKMIKIGQLARREE